MSDPKSYENEEVFIKAVKEEIFEPLEDVVKELEGSVGWEDFKMRCRTWARR